MLTPSSLTELPFRSPDSSSFANASLPKQNSRSVFNYSSAKTQQSNTTKTLIAKCSLLIEFIADIHDPQMTNLNFFGDSLTATIILVVVSASVLVLLCCMTNRFPQKHI